MQANSHSFRAAVVLSCAGAPDGDINVVRALGRQGIPVYVASEYATPPASVSRYCRELILVPGFTKAPAATVAGLVALAERLEHRPVLFPTADPDLEMVTAWRSQLEVHFDIPIAPPDLVGTLTDKLRFAEFASHHGFPVPATCSLAGVTDLDQFASGLDFPVIVKPADTLKWARPEIEQIVGSLKALIAPTRDEFISACTPLMPYADNLLVQRYIPGGDECYYDLQAYLGRDGNVQAWFTARKIRTSPPAVGAGCYVESVVVEELAALGLKCLRDVGYSGLIDMDFKRDPRTGEYFLIEMNPRTAAWNILPTAAGICFPCLAYADLTGLPNALPGKQKEGLRYLHFKNDFKAFRQYRKAGQWTWMTYLRSLIRHGLVFQLLAFDDLRPFLHVLGRSVRAKFRGLILDSLSLRNDSPRRAGPPK
jgi:predicted ATP-grasp superfamily ATP-dependent carboligase